LVVLVVLVVVFLLGIVRDSRTYIS
jgi:hypothetical protein